jgi:hypothetical protein
MKSLSDSKSVKWVLLQTIAAASPIFGVRPCKKQHLTRLGKVGRMTTKLAIGNFYGGNLGSIKNLCGFSCIFKPYHLHNLNRLGSLEFLRNFTTIRATGTRYK